jgi:copper transport protein
LFGALGAALICVCCVLTGHEATHGFAVQFAVALHVLAASIWLGGLVALGITLRARRRASDLVGGAIVVRRFSIVMSSTVAVLIAAGVVLTWLLLGSVGRLVTTDYGLVLSAKIALAAVVVTVAAFNQRRLVPAVVARSTRGWQMLARTVLVEQAALLVVVSLTAVLVNLDPRG